ncbi:phosphoribosylglycinamide formyltransferase [Latilactobacillus fuchuensis]|uniref:phosphoribosylglycinamide formyltransferase n=1 Tax=Latilactobacillus fuchuensis TaxID=164393 RepID=UPI0039B07FC1
MKVAIFASGTGSNFEAIADHAGLKSAGLEIVQLVCDQPSAPVIAKAQDREIPVTVLRPKQFANRQVYEQAVVDQLAPLAVDYILLAGYMRIITPVLLKAYPQRIINIHPALLPAFPGIHSIEEAYQAQVAETGVTIHYIDEGVDSGPIIAQAVVPLRAGESLVALETRIHATEHQLYPEVIQTLIKSNSKEHSSR